MTMPDNELRYPQQPQQLQPPESDTDEDEAESEQESEPENEFPETGLTEDDEDEIFGLDDEDIVGGSDDLDDILGVSSEDVMGVDPLARKKRRKMKRTTKRYQPPPNPSLGGMQY